MIEVETKIRILTSLEYHDLLRNKPEEAKAMESALGYLWFYNVECVCWELLTPRVGLSNTRILTHVVAHGSLPILNFDGTLM